MNVDEIERASQEEVDDFLEHVGVKGMKWGVRRQKRLDRLNRVAKGKSTRGERARVLLTETSNLSLGRHGGLQGAAANRAKQLAARKKRIQKGQATVKDLLALHGADRLVIA